MRMGGYGAAMVRIMVVMGCAWHGSGDERKDGREMKKENRRKERK